MTNHSVNGEEKITSTAIVQSVLLAIIFLIAVTGNGLVCFVVYHFKQLRTIPNILIVNLSVIDLINSLINMPLFAGFYIFKGNVFRGRLISYVFTSLHNYMLYLNVINLIALMADRYGAIKFKQRYHAWKTMSKVRRAIVAIWIAGTALLAFLSSRRDRMLSQYEGLSLIEYRQILYKAEGWKIAICVFGTPLMIFIILGTLIWRSVRASRRRIKAISGGDNCSPQGRKMLQLLREKELQTTRNIAIIVVAYFVCFAPAIAYGVCLRKDIHVPWLEYFAFFFTYFTSACNPIVYSLRTCRFRQVIRDLLKPKRKRNLVLPIAPITAKTLDTRRE